MHNEENKNNSNAMKRAKFTLTSTVVLVMVIASVIIANLLVRAIGERIPTKIDITKSQVLNFTDETKQVINGLNKEVVIYSLIPRNPEVSDELDNPESFLEALDLVEKALERYSQMSSKITYKRIDAQKNPDFLYRYSSNDKPISHYSIIVECGDKFRVIDVNAVLSFNAEIQRVQFFSVEQKVTMAIVNVIRENDVTVGFVNNHSAILDFDVVNQGLLQPGGYKGVEVDLMTGGVPDDVDVLMIVSPTLDFSVEEINQIDMFFDKGGKVQLIIDHSSGELPVLETYLAEWGVTLYDGYLVETDAKNIFNNNPACIMPQIISSPITDEVIDNKYKVIYPEARGMRIDAVSGIVNNELLVASETAGVYDVYNVVDGDVVAWGPITISTILSGLPTQEGTPLFMITGGTGIFYDVASSANIDIVYNSLDYMANNEEGVYIRPKDISSSVLLISKDKSMLIAAFTVGLIPLLLLGAGFAIWFIRRRL